MRAATVLVVEDNPITRKMFRVTLTAAGYRVLEAANGQRALDLVEQDPPELVLQDLKLPDMDGFELATRLRATPAGASVPIVAVSGFLSKMEQAQSGAVGFTDFLFKPVEPSRLVERVQALLRPLASAASIGAGRVVVTVDDDPIQLKLLTIHLEAQGFRVRAAADGAEALAHAKRLSPAAVVADVLMSPMDGFTLCQAIRRDPALADVPVVLMSAAYVDEADRALARAAGANAYVVHAPDLRELDEALGGTLRSVNSLPQAQLAALPIEAYLQRTIRQLGRQANLNQLLTRRVAHLEGELAIVAGLVDVLAADSSLQVILEETLGRCLNTAGLSAGAIYVFGQDGGLLLRAQVGYSDTDRDQLADCFGVADFFLRSAQSHKSLLLPSSQVPDDRTQDILARWDVECLALLPLVVAAEHMGLLVAASDGKEIDVDVVQFLQICGNHAAQAIRLARVSDERQALEGQFHQSQKLEAIGRLAGGIAHDFNNLLTAIVGYSDLLLQELPDADQHRDVEEIRKAGHSAAALTRQILAFSRKQVFEPVVLDLNAVFTNLDRMLRRLIGEDVEVVARLDSELGRVKADPGQIEQVILNLAVNARDAMPQGGTLTIETANVQLDENYARTHVATVAGRYVMLSVSDTGHGMDEYTRSRLFEPFFTTKEQGKGTGLGLATVYGIVKQSGGNIWVYSEPEHGTIFRLYLPLVEEVAEPVATAARPSRPPTGTETVLVVEDNAGLRALARKLLERYGYNVLDAQNGDEALLLCQRHQGRIDLLLSDVVMPGMSGRTLADRLGPQRPEMKVLYTSGHTDDAIALHGTLDRGTAFLPKPYTMELLTHKVRQVLDAPK